MTTNAQPSPTRPTQTPHSEPESSTGPDQLTWAYHAYPGNPRGGSWYATTTHGAYLISRETPAPHDVWGVLFGPAPHTAAGPKAPTIESPGPLREMKAAVEQHHRAVLRKLAWQRYMLDNDPPAPRTMEYTIAARNLVEVVNDAQKQVHVMRQILGLK